MRNSVAQTLTLGGILSAGMVMAGSFSDSAFAADMELRPSLTISEEFNDNIHETADNRRTDYITRVQPGATFRYLTPRLNCDSSYTFEYRNYARNSKGDEYNHNASLRGTVALVENFLFVDVDDTYQRVSLDVTRDMATESSLYINQTDENRATISPYMLWRLGEKGTIKTGYRYTDVRYWGDGIERREHGAFADLNREITSNFSLSAGYLFTRLLSDSTDYSRHDLYGGFRYQYAEKSFLYGQAGNSWQDFDTGRSTDYMFWNAGVTHDFTQFTLILETKVQNSSDPQTGTNGRTGSTASIDPLNVSDKQTIYSGRVEKAFDRGSISFSTIYTEYDDTGNSQDSAKDKLSFNIGGNYEILEKLNLGLSVTGEHTDYRSNVSSAYYNNDNYPYRFISSARLSYTFKDDLTIGLNYIYTTNLRDLVTTSDAEEVNRVIVEIRKVF
jgi:hypothetical protein